MTFEHSPASATGVTIVIPTYNEENGIEGVVAEIREKFIKAGSWGEEDVEIIIIDDGSTDGTARRAQLTGARVITHAANLGYGASIKTALRLASHELIMMTDADGTYPAEYFAPLLSALADCDMAVGARNGERVHIPLTRRPAKWLLRRIAVFLAEKPIPDLNSGMRAFRKPDAMRFLSLYPSGFSFTTTITLAYLSSDLVIKYVPINYNPRMGASKIRPLRDTKNLFLTIVRSILFFNPLRVCIPAALALFLVALYVLVFLRDSHGNVLDGTLTVLLISAVQITVMGFLADIISRMR